MKLNPMEIRKCVYYGKFFEYLEKMNLIDEWRDLIGRQKLDNRFRDIELILRVLALKDNWEKYEKPMKQFLNNYMIAMNSKCEEQKEEIFSGIFDSFKNVCIFLLSQLGSKPFHLRNRLNYAVMDSIMIAGFYAYDAQIEDLASRRDSLLKEQEYLNNVTANTSDENPVKSRIGLAIQHLTH